jgi:DnaJ-class molecular chaperone
MEKATRITPYQTLSLKENSNFEAVKSAYKHLAKTHHPDKGGRKDTM